MNKKCVMAKLVAKAFNCGMNEGTIKDEFTKSYTRYNIL